MVNIAQMRQAMATKEQSTSVVRESTSSSVFSFKDLKAGDEIKIRFIEDKDEKNSFFWRENHRRTLMFDSVKLANGQIVNNRAYVSVPAFNLKSNDQNIDNLPEEYLFKSNEDAIQQAIKGFWVEGDKDSQALYSKFSKKTTYIFQGFVHTIGYEPKLYRFVITKDLFPLIKSFLSDSEIEDAPCDIENGRDFILKVGEKTAVIQGQNQKVKDYSTSKWSSKITPLTEAEREYLATTGAWNLSDFIKKKPSDAQQEIMMDMYHASYNGEPYDVAKWLKDFRPDNLRFDENGNLKDVKSNLAQTNEVPTSSIVEKTKQVLVDSPVRTKTMEEELDDNIPDFDEVPTSQPVKPTVESIDLSSLSSIPNSPSKEAIAAEIMKKLGIG